jgi:hypothetical protein
MNAPPFTITNESIIIVWEGKSRTVRKGTPNYAALRQAIIEERWDDIEKNLTIAKSLSEWAKGRFTLVGNEFLCDGKPIPKNINTRIVRMASDGEDPEPLFKFWERLQKNPSYRSVNQLFEFLSHEGIPITEDGCFLAYKNVRQDYKDHHTGSIDNSPGITNEMPRNQISDDPKIDCHDGFHVGAYNYAKSFNDTGRMIICKVDPENVVCVPYDASQEKMRVCKYEVVGNHNGQQMPSTVIPSSDIEEVEEKKTNFIESAAKRDESKKKAEKEKKSGVEKPEKKRKAHKFDEFDTKALLDQSIEDLRKYASAYLHVVGAYKIPGGKTALVSRIMEIRQ